MNDIEKKMMVGIRECTLVGPNPYLKNLIMELSITNETAEEICERWCKRGWYTYGHGLLAGWLTPLGESIVDQLMGKGETVPAAETIEADKA